MNRTQRSNCIAALVAAMLCFPLTFAFAVSSTDSPSASILPASSHRTDPNGGQWFVMALGPGEEGRSEAIITNPGDDPLHVKLYLRDLHFNADGDATVNDLQQSDVGSWGRFANGEADIPPRSSINESFIVDVPSNADPGDHIGAVVAESQPQRRQLTANGNLDVIKRVAVRLYVTLPGDAIRSFEIDKFQTASDSPWFISRLTTTTKLINTGRVRLHPKVRVSGTPAQGPDLLLSKSSEKYINDVHVPWYGGPVAMQVLATADGGLIRKVDKTVFIFQWLVIVGLLASIAVGVVARRWWRRRVGRMAALQSDIRRLETLISHQQPGIVDATVDPLDEETHAILGALKRARRSGSKDSAERLVLALHELTHQALDEIMESLQSPTDERRGDLIKAASEYGPIALASKFQARLPHDVAEELIAASAMSAKPDAQVETKRVRTASASTGPPKPKAKPARNSDTTLPPARAKRKTSAPVHARQTQQDGTKRPRNSGPKNEKPPPKKK
ncbi:MAG: hypothetical protein ABR507_04680 [Actinomycetota bacterium]|nr:hypothetical protein [Actinomycetota bacterium]